MVKAMHLNIRVGYPSASATFDNAIFAETTTLLQELNHKWSNGSILDRLLIYSVLDVSMFERMERQEKTITPTTDDAYCLAEVLCIAAEKNILLITTDLRS